jgi:hypothetical protein
MVRRPARFGASDTATTAAGDYVLEHHVAPLVRDEATRRRLIEEHRRLPLTRPGRHGAPALEHGPDLARLLDWLRTGVVEGKYVLVHCADCEGLRIAQMPDAPGRLPALVDDRCHADPAEAEHAVFVRRVGDLLAHLDGRSA